MSLNFSSLLELIGNFLKSSATTNWLMVIITGLYVRATISIMRANKAAADAAQKQLESSQQQLEEAKRQSEEARRLEFMPYLQLQKNGKATGDTFKYFFSLSSVKPHGPREYYTYKLVNIGNGTATNICFQCKSDSPIPYQESNTGLDSIMKGDGYNLRLNTAAISDIKGTVSGSLTFTYSDLIGHNYIQEFQFLGTWERGSFSFTNKGPILQ